MRNLSIVVLALVLLITACAGPRQKLSPKANVALRTANMYYNQKIIEDAEKNYIIVLEDRPDHAEALSRMGRICYARAEQLPGKALENYTQSFDYVSRSIETFNSFDPITEADRREIKELTDLRTSAWTRIFQIAEKEREDGNTKEAVDIYRQLLEMDPQRDEPLRMMYEVYRDDPTKAELAEQTLMQIYEKNPEDVGVLKNLGAFYYNDKEDYTKALEYYEKVKAKEPTDVNTLQLISTCQFELEMYDEALSNLQMVLNIEPQNTDALFDAKVIAHKLENLDLALEYMRKLLAIHEGEEELREITYLLAEMNRPEEMITMAEKWHELDPTSKDAVLMIINAAKATKNKTLENKYSKIYKDM
jgi:tetratricopeptide (TPR) repeat protein